MSLISKEQSGKRSYSCNSGVSMIYEGSKSLWKSRTNIEIFIADHLSLKCWEIISYNSTIGVESERIYINSALLSSKVDPNELEEKMMAKKEVFARQKKSFSADLLLQEVTTTIMINYIISRINMPNDLPIGTFKVILFQFSGDLLIEDNSNRLDIIVEKPEKLEPVNIHFKKNVTTSEFNTMLTNFKRESLALQEHNQFAESALTSEDAVKNLLADRMKKELEMKRQCSAVRLRWISAINRVLVQNYIAKVKQILAAYEAKHGPLFTPVTVVRAKLTRRTTLDNSKLNNNFSLPSINTQLPYTPGGTSAGNTPTSLPAISSKAGPQEANRQRRRSMSKSTDTKVTRRSFDPTVISNLQSISERKIPTIEELTEKAEQEVPTLKKSFTDKSLQNISRKSSIKVLDTYSEKRGGVIKAIK